MDSGKADETGSQVGRKKMHLREKSEEGRYIRGKCSRSREMLCFFNFKTIAHSARLVYKNCKNRSFVQPIKNFNDVSWVNAMQLIHVHVVLLLNRTPSCEPLNLQSSFLHVEAQTVM